MSDPTVAEYEQRLTEAKAAIRAAIRAAPKVARPGLPAHQLVQLAVTQLGHEIAAARSCVLYGTRDQTDPRCLLCGGHSPEAGVCGDCEWRHFTEEHR